MSESEFESEIETLHLKLNRETAKLTWHELQRHFAAGAVVEVEPSLDLIEVAVAFANDDSASVSGWMSKGGITKVDDQRAAHWLANEAAMWTVVVRPWVLVQEAT